MKKLVLTMVLGLFALSANAQSDAISKYFDKYVDDESFMHLNFSGKMFQMIAQIQFDNPEEQKMVEESLGKIKRVQVLGKDGDVDGRKMYKEAIGLIGKDFEELMSLREDDKDIRFLIKEKNNKIDELFMVMGGDREFGLLSIVGDGIDLNAIYKLSKSIGMEGFEELEFLDKMDGN
ncbi:DUF4252 domain-containing protein [Roseivirga misakiensis]|uniref:DUF4252 domain-containing protein n=1 Tax=Roseivirga misakiensis TaxID=1563681 RepID=A0A1E5T123_9BACT|nr:DUF4252 domain-containing protein [Roseivirga misakiensis]OEK05082.1 hypothetical protein BFP71_16830 [Roseivirga misakiensis]